MRNHFAHCIFHTRCFIFIGSNQSYVLIFCRLKRKHISLIFQYSNCLCSKVVFFFVVFSTAYNFLGVFSCRGSVVKHSTLFLELQNTLNCIVNGFFLYIAVYYCRLNVADKPFKLCTAAFICQRNRHKQIVNTGINGQNTSLSYAEIVRNSSHIHSVRSNNTLKAQLVSKNIGNKGF